MITDESQGKIIVHFAVVADGWSDVSPTFFSTSQFLCSTESSTALTEQPLFPKRKRLQTLSLRILPKKREHISTYSCPIVHWASWWISAVCSRDGLEWYLLTTPSCWSMIIKFVSVAILKTLLAKFNQIYCIGWQRRNIIMKKGR